MILLLGLGDGVNGCPIYRDKEWRGGSRFGGRFQGENESVSESEVLIVHLGTDI